MITITNKNIYYSDFSISVLSSMNDISIVPVTDIVRYLSDNVELGESVIFRRLFSIISCNIDKFNEIFYSSLGGYSLGPYLQEIENNPTETIESEYLEIHWVAEKFENDLSLTPAFHGISTKDSYALDFTSLNNLKNHNIRLNKSVDVFNFKEENEELKHINLGEKSFTLFELFNAIFFEISFHGAPQDKKERFEEIEESIKEVEGNLEEMKESGELISFDDMIKKFDAKDKYLVKYKEIRDRVEKDRVSNKKNLTKLKNCLKEKLKIYDAIENSEENLEQFYKKITDIEYNLQILYGEEEDITYHKFWETPKCICPKIDNLEIYPSIKPIFNDKCPIHRK
jgi:hypothetical protein